MLHATTAEAATMWLLHPLMHGALQRLTDQVTPPSAAYLIAAILLQIRVRSALVARDTHSVLGAVLNKPGVQQNLHTGSFTARTMQKPRSVGEWSQEALWKGSNYSAELCCSAFAR